MFLLTIQTIFLILFLNATPSIIETTARFSTAYNNFISVDFITQTEHINTQQFWILNWPGFSILISMIAQLTKIPSNAILLIYPTLVNILLFTPLYIFFRTLKLEMKAIWIAIWFVYFGNWVGQDYFSMQSLAFLVIVLLFYLLSKQMNNEGKSKQWFFLFFLLFFYLTTSHLLSPLIIIFSVFALYITRNFTRFSLLAAFITIVAAWTIFDASTYLNEHFLWYLQQTNISQNLSSNFENRVSLGSISHMAVANTRVLYTIILVGFATIGIIASWRNKFGNIDKRLLIILASFAVPLFGFAYGGEMFMRIYMFSLLPLGYFAARATLKYKKISALFVAFLILLAPALTIIAHYGNEAQDYVPPSEIAGINFFYSKTSSGDIVVGGGARDGEFRDSSYRKNYTYVSYYYLKNTNSSSILWNSPNALKTATGYVGKNQYVLLTYSSQSYYAFFYGQPEFLNNIETNISRSLIYNLVYSNPSFSTYALNR